MSQAASERGANVGPRRGRFCLVMLAVTAIELSALYAVDFRYELLIRDGPGAEALLGIVIPLERAKVIYDATEWALITLFAITCIPTAFIMYRNHRLLRSTPPLSWSQLRALWGFGYSHQTYRGRQPTAFGGCRRLSSSRPSPSK